jgi:hypothetical protein
MVIGYPPRERAAPAPAGDGPALWPGGRTVSTLPPHPLQDGAGGGVFGAVAPLRDLGHQFLELDFAAIVFPQPNIALPAIRLSALGAMLPEWQLQFDPATWHD